jgi:hypothetical protein
MRWLARRRRQQTATTKKCSFFPSSFLVYRVLAAGGLAIFNFFSFSMSVGTCQSKAVGAEWFSCMHGSIESSTSACVCNRGSSTEAATVSACMRLYGVNRSVVKRIGRPTAAMIDHTPYIYSRQLYGVVLGDLCSQRGHPTLSVLGSQHWATTNLCRT